MRRPLGPVAAMLDRRGHGAVCASIVVAAELRFGARKLGFSVLSRKLDDLLAALNVLLMDAGVDRTCAESRFQLEQSGTPIGPNDLLIAAQALDLGLIVVTDNVDEFARV
jgi:tRNA(fMet)-specific endonuclease VapC